MTILLVIALLSTTLSFTGYDDLIIFYVIAVWLFYCLLNSNAFYWNISFGDLYDFFLVLINLVISFDSAETVVLGLYSIIS